MKSTANTGSAAMMVEVQNLDLRWIRGKTGDWGATIAEIEKIAAEIMVKEEMGGDFEWCHNYVLRSAQQPHSGDCGICRSWLTAPITCDACVYDEYMLKAWAVKRDAIEAAQAMTAKSV